MRKYPLSFWLTGSKARDRLFDRIHFASVTFLIGCTLVGTAAVSYKGYLIYKYGQSSDSSQTVGENKLTPSGPVDKELLNP